MNPVQKLLAAIRGNIRYKMLVLVLFPIMLVMPVALAFAIIWGANFTYEQLFIKVNTDLSVSNDIFERIRTEYLNHLSQLGESFIFRTALGADNSAEIDRLVDRLKVSEGFSYLNVLDSNGRYRNEDGIDVSARVSSSLLSAFQGKASVGMEIYSAQDLGRLSRVLQQQVSMDLIDTPRARPESRTREDRGMMIRSLYPVKNSTDEVIAILDGGVLLNGNFQFVDTIRDLVYGPGSLSEGGIGTVTVFLDDVRITTNVPLRANERALGTRVSNEVRTHVLDEGQVWLDRAFVVNDWYISSYEPILDVDGNRIGMLYAGFLESPYRNALWQALAVLVLLFLGLMLMSAVASIRGAKSIFKPLELITDVVQATSSGTQSRIGDIESRDELGELARGFDAMLNLLQRRSEEIQQWADQLEDKVEERTAELIQKNADLQNTIRALRKTRQQLVIAEKLAALGELTAGVAHEINNPTQVILGNLDVMVDQLGPAIDPVRSEVDLVVQQVYRIQAIINNLLQYARPSEYAGYMAEVDVNTVVQDTLQLVKHLRQQYAFNIKLVLKSDVIVLINQQELQQVILNLLVNAIHALPDVGGEITISTMNWDDRGVAVVVRDNGSGIAEEDQSHIFNPFYSTKGQGEGTGLGLSVSYGLIRKYGGDLKVSSTTGKGAEFVICLLKEPEYIEDEDTIAGQLNELEQSAEKTLAHETLEKIA